MRFWIVVTFPGPVVIVVSQTLRPQYFLNFPWKPQKSFAGFSNSTTACGLEDIPISPPAAASLPKDPAPKNFKTPN